MVEDGSNEGGITEVYLYTRVLFSPLSSHLHTLKSTLLN